MEDARFRTLLRSLLAASLATPAVIAACGSVTGTPLTEADDDSGTTGGVDAATISADASNSEDAGACLHSIEQEGGFPKVSRACGCAALPPSKTCLTYQQLPCKELTAGQNYDLATCQKYCAANSSGGHPLKSCRSITTSKHDTTDADPGDTDSVPMLECNYGPACGCEAPPAPTTPGTCMWNVPFPCSVLDPNSTYHDAAACNQYCYQGADASFLFANCNTEQGVSGPYLKCYGGCAGRRPEGLEEIEPASGSPIGAWFADASRLEAASVFAFRALREELTLFGAPSHLIERAERAERDEVRHARMMKKLAHRYGAEDGAWSAPPTVHPSESRTLEEIAIENAVEGCVNETYAALLAMWQAEQALHPDVRDAMRAIAEDETRHAALAWSVAEWLTPELDANARDRVAAAMTEAVAVLRSARAPHEALIAGRVLPTSDEHARLVSELTHAFWT